MTSIGGQVPPRKMQTEAQDNVQPDEACKRLQLTDMVDPDASTTNEADTEALGVAPTGAGHEGQE